MAMGGLVEERGANKVGMVAATATPGLTSGPVAEYSALLRGGEEFDLNHVAYKAENGVGEEAAPILYALAYLASTHLRAHPSVYVSGLKHKFREHTPSLLAAYHHFALNIVSVDASFVRVVLDRVCDGLLQSEHADIRTLGVRAALDVLDMYGAADDVLAAALRRCFPHLLRPAEQIVHYVAAALDVAAAARSHRLRAAIIALVVEQLVEMQYLVPDEILVEEPTVPAASPAVASDGTAMVPAEAEDPPALVLCAAAEKMDKLLAAVFAYLDGAHAQDAGSFCPVVLEPLVQAYVRLVVPARCGRFMPSILVRALALVGRDAAEATCERLLRQFFDARVHTEARLCHLALSATVVGRVHAQTVSAAYALDWMRRVASWTNRYVDSDAYPHELFLGAVRVLLTLAVARPDAFDPAAARGPDALPRLRLLRVLDSDLTPGAAVPPEVRRKFASMAGVDSDAARRWALKARGRRRNLSHLDLMRPSQLPEAERAMAQFYRPSPHDN